MLWLLLVCRCILRYDIRLRIVMHFVVYGILVRVLQSCFPPLFVCSIGIIDSAVGLRSNVVAIVYSCRVAVHTVLGGSV